MIVKTLWTFVSSCGTVCSMVSTWLVLLGGVMVVGQDQDEIRGGYNPRQSWSGGITQVNLWDFSIEKWDIENIAKCRSDAFGNVMKV